MRNDPVAIFYGVRLWGVLDAVGVAFSVVAGCSIDFFRGYDSIQDSDIGGLFGW